MTLDPIPLEREEPLQALAGLLAQARTGRGHAVVVSGAAGLGKTTLLNAAQRAASALPSRPGLRWMQAGCDPLHTPRPLGPLVDLAHALPPALQQAVHEARTYNGLFPSLLSWLAGAAAPAVLAIEDLHWADEATLDCVRYLGRRVSAAGLVLIVTLRPEPVDALPALRQTLAALDAAACLRIELQPLSAAAVQRLAREAGRAAGDLHARTGGNPFYVRQLLSAGAGPLPASLRDAVLAQVQALGADARELLELLCLSPAGLELDRLQALRPRALAALDEAAVQALVQVRPPWAAVRHDLARQVLEEAVPPARGWLLHRELAQALAQSGPATGLLARRVHHAAAAGMSHDVCSLAPQAAAEAEALGSQRSAARLLRLALEHGVGAGPLERAGLFDRLATCNHSIHAAEEAVAARRAAMAARDEAGDLRGRAMSQAQLALQLTPAPEAESLARQAVDTLQALPPGPGQALAHSALAIALANQGRAAEALEHARAAPVLAQADGDADAALHAQSIAASVELSLAPSPQAFARLERCVADDMALGRPQRVAVPLVNLCSVALVHADYARVIEASARGMAYCVDRDLDSVMAHLLVRRALALVELARWDETVQALDALKQLPSVAARQAASAAVLRDRIQALRGLTNDARVWQAHVEVARAGRTDLLPNYVVTAAAEAAWLRGDTDLARDWAQQGLQSAEGPWVLGHLRAWLRRCGGSVPAVSAGLSPPHALAESGRWREAANEWLQRQCPIAAAWALLDSGDAAAQREALQRLLDAGAEGAVRRARVWLRLQGLEGLERGPYGHARADPLGLTRRERQIAELLAQGLSNADIAGRLHRSERTVAHHVSALLGKLGLSARTQVAARLSRAEGGDARPQAQAPRRRRTARPSTAPSANASDDGSGTVPG